MDFWDFWEGEPHQPCCLCSRFFPPDEQAETISSTVKALAEQMSNKDSSKNHYQGIFSELYCRFGVSSYKNIRLDRYEQVLSFLGDWYQSVKLGRDESDG